MKFARLLKTEKAMVLDGLNTPFSGHLVSQLGGCGTDI